MSPNLYWITGPWPGRLAISARPRGGDWLDDEARGWKAQGLNVVASLLEPEEEETLNLKDEKQACLQEGLQYRSFPIVDRGVPKSSDDASAFIRSLEEDLAGGMAVAVHCRQGLGRSALIAAGLLVAGGLRPGEAISRVTNARGVPVPETVEQKKWIENLPHLVAQPHQAG